MSFETERKRVAICPHCGTKDLESCELGDGGQECGETECNECGKAFIWIRHVYVSYSTKKEVAK